MGMIILISVINLIFVILGYYLGACNNPEKPIERQMGFNIHKFNELFKKEELEDAYIPEED